MRKAKKRLVYFLSGVFSFFVSFIFNVFEKTKLNFINEKVSYFFVKALGEEALSFRREFDVLENKKVNKFILALPSFGCEHYFSCGGCSMCGFNYEIIKYGFRNLHPEAINLLVSIFLNYFYHETKKKKIDVMCVFMAGSFLNDSELPLKAQNLVLNYFKRNEAKKLIIESRPEYIIQNKEKIKGWTRSLKEKKIKINLGLEASDEFIRSEYINKSLNLNDYQQSVQILKSFNVLVATYILIGCPFLSEKKIIEESLKSAKFAWQSGSDMVNIEVYCVQKGTKWYILYKKGFLFIPNLWLIVDFLKTLNQISDKWKLGEFFDWPKPIAYPRSCFHCEEKILNSLKLLRKEHNIDVLNDLECFYCQINFKKEGERK